MPLETELPTGAGRLPTGAGREPGEVVNRVSLDTNDSRWSAEVSGWEDGVEYVFNRMRVVQISPGEYEVMEATVSDESPAPNTKLPERPPKTPSAIASNDHMGRPNAALQGKLGSNR